MPRSERPHVQHALVRGLRLTTWTVVLAAAVVSAWSIAQTLIGYVAQGRFLSLPPVRFLWWTFDVWAIVPLAVLVASLFVMWLVWPRPPGRMQSRTGMRILLWLAIVGLLVACTIQVLTAGSSLWAMLRGSEVPAGLIVASIGSTSVGLTHLAWLGFVFVSYLFGIYLGMSYRSHVRNSGRGIWGAEGRTSRVASSELVAIGRFRVSDWQRELFIDLLTDGPKRITRIQERVRPYTRSTAVHSEYSIRLVGLPTSGHVVIPVFATARGQLEDGLKISRPRELPLISMVSVDSSLYAAAIVRSCIGEAGEAARDAYQNGPLKRRVVGYLRRSTALQTMSPAQQRSDALAFARLLAAILALPTQNESPLYRAVLLLSALYQSVPNVVSIPAQSVERTAMGPTVEILVDRRTTPSLTITSYRTLLRDFREQRQLGVRKAFKRLVRFMRGKAMDQVRLWFGVKSNRLAHSLGNASRALSYHLEFVGQEDTYMARQMVENLSGWEEDQELFERVQARASPAVGQRHSHLHIWNGGRHLWRFRYSVAYFERTPGSMALSFVAAASALLISVIVALREGGLQTLGDDSSSLFEILFAFPIVSAAAGALRSGQSQWGGVLSARVANVVTIIASLVGLWLSFLVADVDDSARPRVWLFVILVLAVVTAACLGSWVMRIFIHSRFVDPTEDDETDSVAGIFEPSTALSWWEGRKVLRRARRRVRRGARPGATAKITSTRQARRSRRRVHKSTIGDALRGARLGPSIWVVPELWESRPWPLPKGFRAMSLSPDERKIAISLGILTIDAVPPGSRGLIVDRQSEPARHGTAARLMERVIRSLERALESDVRRGK